MRAKKEADPAWFDALLTQYVDLQQRGEAALDAGDLPALGGLLDENHSLCQQLTVRCARAATSQRPCDSDHLSAGSGAAPCANTPHTYTYTHTHTHTYTYTYKYTRARARMQLWRACPLHACRPAPGTFAVHAVACRRAVACRPARCGHDIVRPRPWMAIPWA